MKIVTIISPILVDHIDIEPSKSKFDVVEKTAITSDEAFT